MFILVRVSRQFSVGTSHMSPPLAGPEYACSIRANVRLTRQWHGALPKNQGLRRFPAAGGASLPRFCSPRALPAKESIHPRSTAGSRVRVRLRCDNPYILLAATTRTRDRDTNRLPPCRRSSGGSPMPSDNTAYLATVGNSHTITPRRTERPLHLKVSPVYN